MGGERHLSMYTFCVPCQFIINDGGIIPMNCPECDSITKAKSSDYQACCNGSGNCNCLENKDAANNHGQD